MSTRFRPRTSTVLALLLVFGSLLVPRPHASSASLAVASALAPVQRVLARAGHEIAFNLASLTGCHSAARENRKLRDQVAALQEQLQLERARSAEKDARLQRFNDFLPHRSGLTAYEVEVVGEAEVVGQGAGAGRGFVFVDRGSAEGIVPGMVAVVGHSAVGIVRACGASVSSVELVTSPGACFDGLIGTTGERGIVIGRGDGTMTMRYVSKSKPEPSAAVVTRGLDGRTPKGFLLGLVASAERRSGSLTYEVTLSPARDLDRLKAVWLVKPSIAAEDFPPTGAGASDE
jgi:rod shape-determining protein MreC